jgi:hypothetical protein
VFYATRLTKYLSYIYFEEFINQLVLIYVCMFIFVRDQELWICELMSRIMSYDHSLIQNDIIKFIYYLIIIFLIYL